MERKNRNNVNPLNARTAVIWNGTQERKNSGGFICTGGMERKNRKIHGGFSNPPTNGAMTITQIVRYPTILDQISE